MNANLIISNITDFFANSNKEDLEVVKEAFSNDMKGDISVNQYLANYYNDYFYTD